MTEAPEEQVDPTEGDKYMNPAELTLSEDIYGAMMNWTRNSERGLQAQEFRAGLSDLGYCSERLRRQLLRQEPDDVDMTLAMIGTALGEGVEQAIKKRHPEAIIQSEVELTLEGDSGTYTLRGHPDIILGNMLLDAKSSDGLAVARRNGADQQKQFQRHTYAKAAHQAGLFGDTALEDVMVGNVWVDRSGRERRPHVQLEPYSEAVVAEAALWLDNVVHAWKQTVTTGVDEQAMKEPPRQVCAVSCGYYQDCRAFETDVSGLITDPELITAAQLQLEASALTKRANALKKEAKAALDGISGMAKLDESGDYYTVRWVHVNATDVPGFTRAGYTKLDVKRMKGGTK